MNDDFKAAEELLKATKESVKAGVPLEFLSFFLDDFQNSDVDNILRKTVNSINYARREWDF